MDVSPNLGIATGAYIAGRDDWEAAIAEATAGGWRLLELTADTEDRIGRLVALLDRAPHALAGFERVSIHAPIVSRARVPNLADTLDLLARRFEIVLHPDVYGLAELGPSLGRCGVFENMDCQKRFGRSVADLHGVFARHARAGFCLDVAHVWTNDPGLDLGHELLDAFGERLRQVHVSGIERDGTHRATTGADLDLYAPLLERCSNVPWLLETELVETPGARRARQASPLQPS